MRGIRPTKKAGNMQRCIVKWFNDSKGYGFATTEDGLEIFIHYTAIETEGFKTLTEGQAIDVDYFMHTSPKLGEYRQATKVVKVK